jgi:flagellar export protein FliJ
MKQFAWRLQRLLDVKTKQQDLLRTELMSLGERIAQIRAGIMMHKAEIRSRLSELRQLPADQRPARQQMFLQFVHVLDSRIQSLERSAADLEEQRKKKIKELMDVRKNQKSLENLRQRAKEAYQQQQKTAQQKDTDETGSTSYARKMCLPTLEQI